MCVCVCLVWCFSSSPTCVAHVVIERRVCELPVDAGLIARLRVATVLVLWRGVGVGAQVARLHGRLRLQAGVVARLHLGDATEHMVQAQAMTDLVDHGV